MSTTVAIVILGAHIASLVTIGVAHFYFNRLMRASKDLRESLGRDRS